MLSDGTFTLSDGGSNGVAPFENIETLLGGTGVNTLDFALSDEAVVVNLAGGHSTDFQELSGFSNVIGSAFGDTIMGNGLPNTLTGGAGDDTLQGAGGNDVIDGGMGQDWLVESRDANFTLTNTQLTASGGETDTLSGIEFAALTGGASQNVIDASGFDTITPTTPLAILNGGAGVNLSANDLKIRLTNGTTVSVNLSGATTIQHVLTAIQAASVRLTATVNATGNGIDVTDSINDGGHIQGSSVSTLAAGLGLAVTGVGTQLAGTALSGGSVVLNGGSTVLLSLLNGGVGVRVTDLDQLDLTGATLVATLNQGAGIRFLGPAADFRITLTDGTTIDVDLTAAILTVQQLIETILVAADAVAPGRLSVVIDPDTLNSLLLNDAVDSGGEIEVTALNGSLAAADLGLLDAGAGTSLSGQSISDLSADLRVTLGDGTRLDLDLSGLKTMDDALERLNDEDPARFTAQLNSAGTGIDLFDTSGGPGPFTAVSINGSFAATDLGLTAAGVGRKITGTSIVTGTLRLDGRFDDDELTGGSGDDSFIGGGGDDVIEGGLGVDRIIAERDADITLTNTQLSYSSGDVAGFTGIERATLTGGANANTIDASAFTLGPVTLDGGEGDDLLKGGAGDDLLTGGFGLDNLQGGGGLNTAVEDGPRAILTSTGANTATLDLAEGLDEVVAISLTGAVTGGSFRLTFKGQSTDAIAWNANVKEVESALTELTSVDGGDVVVVQLLVGGAWVVIFYGQQGGKDQPDLTATSIDLVGGGVTTAVLVQGTTILNLLTDIQRAELDGTIGPDLLDASGFTGSVVLRGGPGNDALIGSSGADTLSGGSDSDELTGNAGGDAIDGGADYDILIESRDVSFTLTNTSLSTGSELDTLANIEGARLTGGPGANVIDASGFTGLNPGTIVGLLGSGEGLDDTEGVVVNLTGSTGTLPLSSLGVSLASGTDLNIVLRNGVVIAVELGTASTLDAVFAAIHAAAPSVTATLDSSGSAIKLIDATAGAGHLTVTEGASTTAADLGLLGVGSGDTLVGTRISDGASDIVVTLTDGTRVYVDLSFVFTLEEVFAEIHASSARLTAALNGAGTAIVVTDSVAGVGTLTIAALNGSLAGARLGIVGTGVGATLTGTPIAVAQVVLDGAGGADNLTGSPGDDGLTGGPGEDVIHGGSGHDTLLEQRDADMTLGAGTLVIAGETDTFDGIEVAELTGGASANTIDATAFTGPVIITSGGGLDTLGGPTTGTGATAFVVDVTGLTQPTSENDTAHQVRVNVGTRPARITILGAGPEVTQSDLWWIDLSGTAQAAADYKLEKRNTFLDITHSFDDVLEVTEDLVFPGRNITLEAGTVRILGHRLDTSWNAGDGGDITIIAKHILIDDGAVLDSRTLLTGPGSTATSGTITLVASEGAQLTGLGVLNLDLVDTDVTIGDATIRGGEVNILGDIDTARYPDFTEYVAKVASPLDAIPQIPSLVLPAPLPPVTLSLNLPIPTSSAELASKIGTKVGRLLKMFEGLSWVIGMTFTRARTHIRIGTADAPTVIEADTVNIQASSKVKLITKPSAKFGVAIGIGVALTEATVSIDNATITTTGDLIIEAVTDHSLLVLGRAFNKKLFAAGVAVTVVVSNASAVVGPSARLVVGRDLFIQAETVDRNATQAAGIGDPAAAIAIAIAVAFESGRTTAALDGTADVVRNVNVTAKQSKLPFLKKRKIMRPIAGAPGGRGVPIPIPSMFTGVSASASLGTPTTGNLLDDLGKSMKAKKKTAQQVADSKAKSKTTKAMNWAKDTTGTRQFGPDPKPKDSTKRKGFQGALAFALSIDENNVTARIGNRLPGQAADVEAGGFVKVTARISNRPDVTSTASTEFFTEGAVTGKYSEKKVEGDVNTGVSIAVTVGLFTNQADAFIAGNATVDAGGALTLEAQTLNAFDPNSTFGTNLAATVPFLSKPQPTYKAAEFDAADDTVVVDGGETVKVADGHTAGGTPGLTYRYIGPDGAQIDLRDEDYSDVDRWASASLASENKKAFIALLTTYLDGNLGLDNNLVDSGRRRARSAQKKAVDRRLGRRGLLRRIGRRRDRERREDQPGCRRQVPDRQPGRHRRRHEPERHDRPRRQLPDARDRDDPRQHRRRRRWAPKDIGKRVKALHIRRRRAATRRRPRSARPPWSSSTPTIVAAQIEDGVLLYGDNLDMHAENGVLGVAFGASGGSAQDFGFTGVGIFNSIDDHTTASIGGGASVELGGSATISASDTTNLISAAGSLTRAEKVGIGASVAGTRCRASRRPTSGAPRMARRPRPRAVPPCGRRARHHGDERRLHRRLRRRRRQVVERQAVGPADCSRGRRRVRAQLDLRQDQGLHPSRVRHGDGADHPHRDEHHGDGSSRDRRCARTRQREQRRPRRRRRERTRSTATRTRSSRTAPSSRPRAALRSRRQTRRRSTRMRAPSRSRGTRTRTSRPRPAACRSASPSRSTRSAP